LLFSNGKINCNGKSSSFDDGIKRLRRYARLLQKNGYCRSLSKIKVITASATHQLENVVRPENIPVSYRYEPELFPALMFRREGVHFTLHLSGSLIITGIKRQKDIDNVIYPVLVELSL
jgi:TATA-box binding protein (TBP) (component of TFIID and TFIIIB)